MAHPHRLGPVRDAWAQGWTNVADTAASILADDENDLTPESRSQLQWIVRVSCASAARWS